MYKRNAQGWSKHFDFFVLDELCLQIAFLAALFLRHESFAVFDRNYRILSIVLILSDALVLVAFNTMRDVMTRGYYVEFVATVRHCFYVFACLTIFVFATQTGAAYSRLVFLFSFALHVLLGYLVRLAWKWHIRKHRAGRRRDLRSMLAVLQPDTAEERVRSLRDRSDEGYRLAGVILTEPDERSAILGVPVVAELKDAAIYICREWIDDVYIDCPSTDTRIARLMDDCCEMAVPVHYHLTTVGLPGTKQFTESIGGTTVLTTSINYVTPVQSLAKRLLDIVGGLVGSVLALVIMLIVGPMIRRVSPGPILYSQIRIGKNGRRFRMYKIRTMVMDADARKQELMEQNRVKDGHMFKLDFDPRIIGNEILPDGKRKTGIGEFLRRRSLDEFPQFFNVLMGQMSLVGTRPPTVDEWERYELHHRARLAIKPGITGLWQVSGRSEITDFEEVVKLDLEYITKWNYGLDIKILLKTIGAMFRGEGAL